MVEAIDTGLAAEWIAVGDLKPWPKNPRKFGSREITQIAESIAQLGFGRPLVARASTRVLIAGHRTLAAAKQLGMARVPVRLVDCTEEQAELMALADNRLQEGAEWAKDALNDLFATYDPAKLAIAGFEPEEIMKSLGLEPPITEDEVPEPPKVPVTKLGDVWRLGRHTLHCADARSVPWPRCSIITTDPPYGVDHVGGTKDPTRATHRSGGVVYGDAPEDFAIVEAVLATVLAASEPGAAWYVCAPAGHTMRAFVDWLCDRGILRQSLVWMKSAFVFGRSDYHYRHEMILYGWVPGAAHHAVEDRTQDSIWEYDRGDKAIPHPTSKPVAMFARMLANSSVRGATVIDPFLGSGTTLIAAEQNDRICHGSEIGPAYCDVIVERWQNLTGGKAERVTQGAG